MQKKKIAVRSAATSSQLQHTAVHMYQRTRQTDLKNTRKKLNPRAQGHHETKKGISTNEAFL